MESNKLTVPLAGNAVKETAKEIVKTEFYHLSFYFKVR